MAGRVNGLQQRMLKENSRTQYFYCVGHQLNLLCQSACTAFPMLMHLMSIVNKIVTFVRGSSKCSAWFTAIQLFTAEPTTVKLWPECSTRIGNVQRLQ